MKKWMMLSANLLIGTTCFAASADTTKVDAMHDGFFAGVGVAYDSLTLTQDTWGKGVGNITTNTGANSNGVGEGNGTPFDNTAQQFAPVLQVGYFKHFQNSPYLYGFKFSYQYLGSTTATNSHLYIPQIGTTTSISGTTSPLFGYVDVNAVKVATNHEFALLGFLGQSFDNKYFYLGVGPSIFNVQSQNYYSIGYAEFQGATVNVTGLVSYSTPSIWLLGGEAQLGMTYFISPTLFVDASYTYAITGGKTIHHQQPYSNTSSIGTTNYVSTGNLYTKNTLRINNQSVRITINKEFNL